MSAAIQVNGENIPLPKPLPKPPKPKRISDWKPSIWEAVYRLDAYHDANLKRRCPGFVIEHSCGLSLVHPSESDELGGDDADIRQNWRVTHTASGLGFGLSLSFKRAVDALLLGAAFAVHWNQDAETLKVNPEFRKAGYTVQADFSTGYDRDSSKRRLSELEKAA
jgi:hypothetical protein